MDFSTPIFLSLEEEHRLVDFSSPIFLSLEGAEHAHGFFLPYVPLYEGWRVGSRISLPLYSIVCREEQRLMDFSTPVFLNLEGKEQAHRFLFL